MVILIVVYTLLLTIIIYTTNAAVIGTQVAVMMSGNFTDFGYNNRIVIGVTETEQQLNISDITVVSNVATETEAIVKMTELIVNGVIIILSTTSDHGNASFHMASLNPGVFFGQAVFIPKTLPNLFTFLVSSEQMYYSLGAFCGAVSQNARIGFIHPGKPFGPVSTINAFFQGVKSTNNNATMYTITVGTYLDADRAAGASNILIHDLGVDVLTGQQDDFTIQQIAIANGMLAINSNGYPLRELYGQAVGTSLVRSWTSNFIQIIKQVDDVISGASPKQYTNVLSTLTSGNIFLDNPSYKVTTDQWNLVEEQLQTLKNGTNKTPYYCGLEIEKWGRNLTDPTTGCLLPTYTAKFRTDILPGVVWWGNYSVPVATIDRSTGAKRAIIGLALIGIMTAIATALVVVKFIGHIIIRRSGRLFLFVMLAGFVVLFSGVVLLAIGRHCTSWLWLVSTGFTMSIGSMLIKNVRVATIFTKMRLSKLTDREKMMVSDKTLATVVVAMVAIGFAILAVWTAKSDRTDDAYIQGVEGLEQYQRMSVCKSTHNSKTATFSLLGYHCLVLLISCAVGFMVRSAVSPELKEVIIVSNTVFVVSICTIIVGTLGSSPGVTYDQSVVLIGFGLLAGTYGAMGMMFLPKIFAVFNRDFEDERVDMSKLRRSMSVNNSSTMPTLSESDDTK